MSSKLKVHFLGIGGSGSSAIAHIAQAQGFEVSGCDQQPFNEFTSRFKKDQLLTGHSETHLDGVDILAVTPAIYSLDPDNAELLAAKNRGLKIITWQEFMGEYLERDKFVIAVCGTHGKSTTTAMVGQLLEEAGLDPTVELGAVVTKWNGNFRIGKSKYFVTEADEFNNNFLVSHPDITIVTSIEMDHPEFFKNFDQYQDSFYQFFLQTRQAILGNLTDQVIAQLLKDLMKESKVSCFDYTKNVLNFPLKVIGDFNVKNAQAAFLLGILLGIPPDAIGESLMNFDGIGRRFEKIGIIGKTTIYSDFAHHPTEVKVTAEAIRERFPNKKILLVFQPHMFSRTRALFEDFVNVFRDIPINETIITDIYPSRELDTGLVNSRELVEAVGVDKVEFVTETKLEDRIKEIADDFDLIVFMGAGPVDRIGIRLRSNET